MVCIYFLMWNISVNISEQFCSLQFTCFFEDLADMKHNHYPWVTHQFIDLVRQRNKA